MGWTCQNSATRVSLNSRCTDFCVVCVCVCVQAEQVAQRTGIVKLVPPACWKAFVSLRRKYSAIDDGHTVSKVLCMVSLNRRFTDVFVLTNSQKVLSMVCTARSRRHETGVLQIEFRIPRSETFFSQPATDPYTIIIICTGIGCWLTEIGVP